VPDACVWVRRVPNRLPQGARFSAELPEDSPHAAREVLARKDARTLAREILAMSQEDFSRAFKGSLMKREAARTEAQRRRGSARLGRTLGGAVSIGRRTTS
jgi:hypothetical protein